MKTVKLASTKYYDNLPTHGSEDAHAFRDLAMEQEVLTMTQPSPDAWIVVAEARADKSSAGAPRWR